MVIETYIFKKNYTGLIQGSITKQIVDWELESIRKMCATIHDMDPYFHYDGLDINTTPIPRYTHIVHVVSHKHIGEEYFCGSHSLFVLFSENNVFLSKEKINDLINEIGWENMAKNFDY